MIISSKTHGGCLPTKLIIHRPPSHLNTISAAFAEYSVLKMIN
jgi:hypothetical protein